MVPSATMQRAAHVTPRDVHVLVPHFKRRLSGVTATVVQLVPEQARRLAERGMGLATLGPGLPDEFPRVSPWSPALWRRPRNARRRVWHARRNVEMLPGIVLRDVLRMPLALMFTSAAQREHSAYTRWLIRRMDRVVATSARSQRYLHVPSTVVTHGIDCERFRPATDRATLRRELGLLPGRRYVGCFGRIRESKGTDLFVDAMIALLPGRPDWTALVTGRTTGEHAAFERSLRERIERAGLTHRIVLLGEVPAIHRWYAALDLYVAPQRWEGFGMTVLEAMASGVPVVATDVGAFPDLIVPEVGTVVPREDAEALAGAAEAFMDEPGRLEGAASAARTHVATHHALAAEAEALCAIYAETADFASSFEG